jgi:hypothetical protein
MRIILLLLSLVGLAEMSGHSSACSHPVIGFLSFVLSFESGTGILLQNRMEMNLRGGGVNTVLRKQRPKSGYSEAVKAKSENELDQSKIAGRKRKFENIGADVLGGQAVCDHSGESIHEDFFGNKSDSKEARSDTITIKGNQTYEEGIETSNLPLRYRRTLDAMAGNCIIPFLSNMMIFFDKDKCR